MFCVSASYSLKRFALPGGSNTFEGGIESGVVSHGGQGEKSGAAQNAHLQVRLGFVFLFKSARSEHDADSVNASRPRDAGGQGHVVADVFVGRVAE